MGSTRIILFMQKAFIVILPILFLIFITSPAFSNTLQYIYDDLGRLSKIVDENGSYAAYEYDAVGNLISISNGTTQEAPPLLQGINPDVYFVDSTIPVVITGQNLLTTSDITSDNPALIIRTLSVTDTSVKLEITVPSDASSGVANISVKTVYGSAQVSIAITKITLSPSQLAIALGSSGSITASISPPVGKDLTIALKSSDSTIASIPQTITISSSGTMTFTVNALTEGVANISKAVTDSLANATSVFVTQPFTPQPGEHVTSSAKPVSVYIMPSIAVDVTPVSLPISVFIQPSTAVDVTPVSMPVSVYLLPSTAVDVTPVSLLISVSIEQSSTVNATTVSPPVSTIINPP